ncbi:hypothetical protein FGB62_76g094 [Gracilaria domingensis]|nr:hypothetical protein FGB62_76g094 [Gracilaria domingensis]
MPSGSPIVEGNDLDNMPMGSSPAMATPMISSTPFAGSELTAGDGPIASSSPVVSADASVTLLTSPSPDLSASTMPPMMNELVSSAVAIAGTSMEPEPSSQGPSPSQGDDMKLSPGGSPTPLAQEAMTPMVSPPPSESPSISTGDGTDGTLDMPLVSASPSFVDASATPDNVIDETAAASFPDSSPSPNLETPIPSMLPFVSPSPALVEASATPDGAIDETAATSLSDTSPSPNMETPIPSITFQTASSPAEASPDPFSVVSPQPSSLMGTPIASMLPMVSEAGDSVDANETPSASAMTLTFEMMTAQVSISLEVSNMMTPDPLLASVSPTSTGPELLEPFDIPSAFGPNQWHYSVLHFEMG